MKKEYLILIALIVLFGAYLFLHKENRDNYTLPEIKKIDVSKITGIVIDKKQGEIVFSKKENTWHLTDKNFLANSSDVEKMLDTLKTFKLSALISQNQDLNRYELDKDHRIQVKVSADKTPVFEFFMGKTAPTFNHTFVMLADDKNVYHAKGSFRSSFDKTVEDFRDKTVLEFKQDGIKQFTIEKDGISKTLISKTEKKDKKEAVTTTWASTDGIPAQKKAVEALLSAVSSLMCESYPDSPTKAELEKKPPLCTIRFENKDKTHLSLFKKDTDDFFTGISSMSAYAFELSSFNGKEIVTQIETLLGIEKPKENKE